MPPIALNISSDPVATSFCAITNANWSYLVSLLHATLSGDPTYNSGNAKPPPDKRNLDWFRANSDGSPDRWYKFAAGQWISRHTMPPDFIGIFAGDPANIPTFDGGNANPISPYDGPFWEKLPTADGRFLVQAGTTPAPDSTVITFGQTGGEEKHLLLDAEIAHKHFVATNELMSPLTALTAANSVAKQTNYDGAASPFSYALGAGAGTATPSLGLTSVIGDPAARARTNLMPPWLAVTFIRRTQRLFYSVAA